MGYQEDRNPQRFRMNEELFVVVVAKFNGGIVDHTGYLVFLPGIQDPNEGQCGLPGASSEALEQPLVVEVVPH